MSLGASKTHLKNDDRVEMKSLSKMNETLQIIPYIYIKSYEDDQDIRKRRNLHALVHYMQPKLQEQKRNREAMSKNTPCMQPIITQYETHNQKSKGEWFSLPELDGLGSLLGY